MKYFTSGFIILQDLIDQAIIKAQTGRNESPKMYMQQFPSSCYVFDAFFEGISNLFPTFMILSFVFSCSMTIKSIVREKELRLKETMRTMGLGNAVHWVAWFIDSFSSMAVACIFLSLILVVSRPQTSPPEHNLLQHFLLVWKYLGALGLLPGLCVLFGF
jgi:ABC-type multidrug transport system permease subunit